MARLARIVVPGLPHHVTQRGNRRQKVFLEDGDYALYRDLLAARCRQAGVAVWAYCLMPNHVHLILVPASADALARALGGGAAPPSLRPPRGASDRPAASPISLQARRRRKNSPRCAQLKRSAARAARRGFSIAWGDGCGGPGGPP